MVVTATVLMNHGPMLIRCCQDGPSFWGWWSRDSGRQGGLKFVGELSELSLS